MKNKLFLILGLLLIFSNVNSQRKFKEAIIVEYQNKAEKLDEALQYRESYGDYAKLTEEDFLKLANDLFEERMDLFNSYAISNKAFSYIEKNRILVKKLDLMQPFEGFKRYIGKMPDFRVSDAYPDVYSGVDLNSEILLKQVNEYKYFVLGYYYNKLREVCKQDTTLDYNVSFLRLLSNDTINLAIREVLLFDHSKSNLQGTDSIHAYLDLYKKLSKKRKNKKAVVELYKKVIKVSKGKKSPDFEFPDREGKMVNLSDFKGQYVYIDIWATWCKPCLIEMEALEKLKKKYKHIVYISISKNDYRASWEVFLKDKKPKGIHLFAKNEHDAFFESYLVQGVPHFMLIDKEGNIINPDGPRPSRKTTEAVLKNLK